MMLPLMCRAFSIVLLASIMALGSSAFAQEAGGEAAAAGEAAADLETPPAPRRVAVLVLAVSGVAARTADSLTELLIGTIAVRGGLRIVGKEEFQARLGHGEARSVECVSSAACLGRVGVELGVDELVAGTIGRRGEMWVFNLNRIDIRSGAVAGRAFREVEGDVGALADALQDSVPLLYSEAARAAAIAVSVNVEGAEVLVDGVLVGIYRGEPVVVEDLSPGSHELLVTHAERFDWTRTIQAAAGTRLVVDASLEATSAAGASPLLWIGLGLTVVAGGAALGFGLSSRTVPEPGSSRAEQVTFSEARQRDATIATVSMIVAVVGGVTALIGLIASDFSGPSDSVDVGLLPGGAFVHARGNF